MHFPDKTNRIVGSLLRFATFVIIPIVTVSIVVGYIKDEYKKPVGVVLLSAFILIGWLIEKMISKRKSKANP